MLKEFTHISKYFVVGLPFKCRNFKIIEFWFKNKQPERFDWRCYLTGKFVGNIHLHPDIESTYDLIFIE